MSAAVDQGLTSDTNERDGSPVRSRASVVLAYTLVTVAAGSGVLLTLFARRHSAQGVVLVVVATLACGGIAWTERNHPRLKLVPVVAAIAIVFGAAVERGPRTSSDLWSYTMYGRIVSAHGESPYEKLPIEFRSDPLFKQVNPIWRRRGSVFGPAYVAFAAGGTALAGASALGNRLFFQLSTALAGGAVLWLVWRRTRSPSALAWLGLHPVFGAVVNGGHNDIFVGLGILIAAALVTRRRGWAAGVVIGIVALMKLTVLLALGGIVLWAWRQRERRLAVRASIAAGAMVLIGYLPILSSAMHILRGADKTVTPESLWNPLAAVLIGHNAGRDLAHPLAPNATLTAIDYASLATVAILALILGCACRAPATTRARDRGDHRGLPNRGGVHVAVVCDLGAAVAHRAQAVAVRVDRLDPGRRDACRYSVALAPRSVGARHDRARDAYLCRTTRMLRRVRHHRATRDSPKRCARRRECCGVGLMTVPQVVCALAARRSVQRSQRRLPTTYTTTAYSQPSSTSKA